MSETKFTLEVLSIESLLRRADYARVQAEVYKENIPLADQLLREMNAHLNEVEQKIKYLADATRFKSLGKG